MTVDESQPARVEPVEISDNIFAAAYARALREAQRRTKRHPALAEELTDASTDALMWARAHCTDAATFEQFAISAVKRWHWRVIERAKEKSANRPEVISIDDTEPVIARTEKPTRPLLIEDLPEDLAIVVRFYFTDGFDLREIALLTGQSHKTVERKLNRAGALLAEGRLKPERHKGARRLLKG